ncbi:PREDICTED: uncharacterized protein LOC105316953 [Amphimedon queenslandica]|uniref:Uncharacterized protein n=1 Tax=Amphimedon queenslandica TaxID=400682 RepID=A0AAN0IUV0_AMPQE|nr:PREDICTED: uncharacterized protein LOC105316953 [Amphimedon queenslandica]|eukprot:XP_011410582.1 PREDICTED: uncharacterized protein LOC105316953 [Amphimedon queenslandica]
MAAHPTVLKQTDDLVELFRHVLDNNVERYCVAAKTELSSLYRELEVERLQHQETKQLLVDESHKLYLLETQLHTLQRQLNREQNTFERAFGILKKKDLSLTPNKMSMQLAALEAACHKKDEELQHKDQTIDKLRATIASMKREHKRQLEDLKLKTKQDSYLSSSFQTANRTYYNDTHTRRKTKH